MLTRFLRFVEASCGTKRQALAMFSFFERMKHIWGVYLVEYSNRAGTLGI
jgi:hypothetical protein